MQDSKRDTDVKNRLLDSVEEGKDGMICENSTETCIFPYVKEMTSASLMHEAGHWKPVLWNNPEGWGAEEGGFRIGGPMCTCGWSMSMYAKNNHNIVN